MYLFVMKQNSNEQHRYCRLETSGDDCSVFICCIVSLASEAVIKRHMQRQMQMQTQKQKKSR